MTLPVNPKPRLRRFHQARWDEPVVFELSTAGQRGILVPRPDEEIRAVVGNVLDQLPDDTRRQTPPALPELAQPQVLRHYLRLSQETLGTDLNIDVGQGTCTLKYSPKVDDALIRDSRLLDAHPEQDPRAMQGLLEIIANLELMLAEISGMDHVSLQPPGGSAAIWTNVAMIRAFHAARGDADQRDEVITTIYSHPSNAACAKTAGYKVITLYPDEHGYPGIDAVKAAVSERTAALLITNPEDTGIYNPQITEIVQAVHDVGGLCAYDQANANGILGVTRARDAGFDLCQFNLHKTFSAPHGSGGPAAGACAVTEELSPFLPIPVVKRDGERYLLDEDRPLSIGKVAPSYGVILHIVRAYAWLMTMGADGLRQVAEISVLNNNYLMHRILQIHGAQLAYPQSPGRIEQSRYSWQGLHEDTGVSSEQIGLRAADFGVHYWTSHHPYVIPQPFTLEPTESYTQAELDEFADILTEVARESREDPVMVRDAPHRQTVHQIGHDDLDDPKRWAVTWRAYVRKYGLGER